MAERFSDLLRTVAGNAKPPPLLPDGLYPGVVTEYKIDVNQNENTFVRYTCKPTGPGTYGGEPIEAAEFEGIDFSKKAMRKDFFITADALLRFENFLKSCGLDLTQGKTYEELAAEVVGCEVQMQVGHYTNKKTGELGNQCEDITGA